MPRKLPSLLLAIALGCGASGRSPVENPPTPEVEPRSSTWKDLDSAGTTLKTYLTTRPSYTRTQAAARGVVLAEVVHGTQLQATRQLYAAIDEAHQKAAIDEKHVSFCAPWPAAPSLVFRYAPHTGNMTVVGDSDPPGTTATWDGPVDEGIGATAALTEALLVLADLERAGLTAPGEFSTTPSSTRKRTSSLGDRGAEQLKRQVLAFKFRFHSTRVNVPAMDNFVEVMIGRAGGRGKVTLQQVNLVEGPSAQTVIGKGDVLEELIDQAEAHFAVDPP